MSTPTLSPTAASNVPHAQHPAADRQPPAPVADDVNRDNASRLRGGKLRTLLRMDRKREPVNVEGTLNEGVRRMFNTVGDRSSGRAAGAESAQDDRASTRTEIESMFRGINPQLVEELLDWREQSDIPIYGNAPRYAQARLLARALATATGGDAERAKAVIGNWNRQSKLEPWRFSETTQADDLATHCLLAKTPLGWDILTALPQSRYVSLADTDDERRHMSTALQACAHLFENLPFDEEAFARPRNLDEARELAENIVAQGMPAPDDDQPRPDANPAFRFKSNVIAARALIGSLSTAPSPKQREAIVLFLGGKREREIDNASMMRHRVNQLFGESNEKRGLFRRMPTADQRTMDMLAKRSLGELAKELADQLQAPRILVNGCLVPDPDFAPEPTTERMRAELHRAALETAVQRVDHRSRSSSIDLKDDLKDLRHTVARRLGIRERDLKKNPAWRAASEECKQLNLDTVRAWMREAEIDPEHHDIGRHLQTLEDMRNGTASRADGIRELVDTLRPGSSLAFTSHGAKGPNVTLWSTIAPEVLKHKWGHPTVTPLPTYSNIKGRGAALILSGDEGPDGAYVDIDVGTFDRKAWTFLAGVVSQIHSETPAHMTDNFWWQVFEIGPHRSTENSEGLKIRIKADTFDEAKRLACKVVEEISDTKSEKGRNGWERLVETACDRDDISVHYQTREDKDKVRVMQTMTVLGQNTMAGPAVPPNKWVGWGVNNWWNAFAAQLSRTKGTTTSRIRGANDESRISTRREQHLTLGGLTYPLPSLTAPHSVWGMSLSGGHGAWWLPAKRFTTGLESGQARLCLPPPGSGGTPYREWAMTELEYIEWQTELFGASSPTPPEHLRNHILPDRPDGARGRRMVIVRQFATKKAAGELNATFDDIETMSSDPSARPTMQRKFDEASARLQHPSTWGEFQVSFEYTNQQQRVTGLPPLGYQNQGFITDTEHDREHVLGRKGGRNTVIGTRVPEKAVPDAENRRILARNEPTRFAPAAPDFKRSPIQELIGEMTASAREEWLPRDPVVLNSHMDNFGHLFHLLQMRDEIYPEDSDIRKRLHEYLGTSDGMAVVDCTPKRHPFEIMKDFEIERDLYIIRKGRSPSERDTFDDDFWKDFDVASFFEANFNPPYRPLSENPPAPQDTLMDHIKVYRTANRLDMSHAQLYSAMIELLGIANVPSNRFILEFGWDELLAGLGLMFGETDNPEERAENLAAVVRIIRHKQHLIDVLGYDPNANGTHFSGRPQPLTLAVIAEAYANEQGNDDMLVEIYPQLMAEIFTSLRGAGDLLPGQIFNGIAMLPDGGFQLAPYDYAGYKGPRPESYKEDRHKAKLQLKKNQINPLFTMMHQRMSAATGVDFSKAQENEKDGRPELPYLASLQQNAHFLRTLAVAKRAAIAAAKRDPEVAELLKETEAQGEEEMAILARCDAGRMVNLLAQLETEWTKATQQTFFEPRKDIEVRRGPDGTLPPTPLTIGAYYRLREAELHPTLTAEIANALWAGIVPPEAMEGTVQKLIQLITPEGIMASELIHSNEQWDGKKFWAMHTYKAVVGLLNAGYPDLARQVAVAYCENAYKVFCQYRKTAEKYGPNGTFGAGGEYDPEFNMTMTNEFLAFLGGLFPECAEILQRRVPETMDLAA